MGNRSGPHAHAGDQPRPEQNITANISSDSVAVLKPQGQGGNWHVTAIPVGKRPEGIDLSPDGREVWTAIPPTAASA